MITTELFTIEIPFFFIYVLINIGAKNYIWN